jgi:uncharacterized protein YrrD
MQFKENAKVYLADGQEAGTLDRVVIDPVNKEVISVIVHKGILFTEDKVVPVSLIQQASGDKVVLRPGAGDMEMLFDFEEEQYVLVDSRISSTIPDQGKPQSYYPYPSAGWIPSSPYARVHMQDMTVGPVYRTRKERHMPEDAIVLEEGAKLIDSEGDHVGDIERILTDAESDQVTHFIISQGLLLKKKRLIPIEWVTKIFEEEVHIAVDADFLDSLPEYELQT